MRAHTSRTMSLNKPPLFANKPTLNNYDDIQKMANQLLENAALEETVCQGRLRHAKAHTSSYWELSSPHAEMEAGVCL